MALIHEKLYKSHNLAKINFSDYIQTLAQQLFFSLNVNHDQIKLHFALEPLFLNLETATPCGLIISELITNVFQHAFPDNKKGELCVRLETVDEQITIIIQDNGVGFAPGFDVQQTESLGLQLVNLLVQQLEGDLEIIQNQGITFKLSFSELNYRQRI